MASGSPRRAALLGQLGIAITQIKPPGIDEAQRANETPRQLVGRLAHDKAKAVHEDGQFTLGADTIVVLGSRILDKTESQDEAHSHLTKLSGRAHKVITSVFTLSPDGRHTLRSVESRVIMKRLDNWEIDTYLATQEWRGKAGAYAIQGMGGAFVENISGSYSAIVGLPLCETRNALIGLGYPIVYMGQNVSRQTY